MVSLKELAELIHGDLDGDPDIEITGAAEIQTASLGTVTFLSNPSYRKYLASTGASAIVVSKSEKVEGIDVIRVDNPLLAFSTLLEYFSPAPRAEPGVHPTALIGDKLHVGKNVSVGPYSVVQDDVELGDDVVVGAQSFIGSRCKVGDNSILKPRVVIYENCVVGKNVLIHSGAVIGCDGFGFVPDADAHHKIPQIGRVIIEDGVEIGGNCTIDRGTIGDTVIGKGSKLDNLVHIAHNVKLGRGCLVAAQVGIAGSSKIGNYVAFGGQSGVTGHVEIGSHAQLAAKAGITKSVPGDKTYAGMPAREIHEKNRIDALVYRLPELQKKLKKLEEEVKQSKEKR